MMVFDINTRAETNYRKKLMDLWANAPAAAPAAPVGG
jgi:hypothetical protein